MKLLFSFLFANAVAASQLRMPIGSSVKVDSPMGMEIMKNARRLEENNNNNNNNQYDWVSGFSIKFQGCHHVQQWNDNVDENADVRIQVKRLVRFRLCPTDTCMANKAAGCKEGYGDYIVDIGTFLPNYYEAKQEYLKDTCQTYLNDNCNCGNQDGDGDGDGDGDAEQDGDGDGDGDDSCAYNCFVEANMGECAELAEIQQGNQANFDIETYTQCAQYAAAQNNGNDEGRRMEENNDNQNNNGLYIGPYCAEKGSAIYMGTFSDDTCTTFSDDNYGQTTFEEKVGQALPFSSTSLVDPYCLSCVELNNNNNNNADGDEDGDGNNNGQDELSQECMALYKDAGKCEDNLASGTTSYPNSNACNYIEGIKVVRDDGIVTVGKARANPVTTAIIVILALAFCALAFYVWYLRTRIATATPGNTNKAPLI